MCSLINIPAAIARLCLDISVTEGEREGRGGREGGGREGGGREGGGREERGGRERGERGERRRRGEGGEGEMESIFSSCSVPDVRTLAISASKLGSDLRDRLDTSFFLQVGHSLLLWKQPPSQVKGCGHTVTHPLLSAVMMHS